MSAQLSIRRGAGIIALRYAPVNSLSQKLRDGILRSLDDALKAKCPAVVLTGDGRMFSAGADIAEFAKGTYENPPNLRFVIQQLDNFPIPLVAFVNGPALGGGMETALACHWRIGSAVSRFALPEVHLGILPGAGGTQRLPRLLGVRAAMDLMTSGRTVGPHEALKLGILDKLIDFAAGGSDSRTNKDASGAQSSHELMIDSAVDFALGETVQSTPIMERKLSARPVPGGLSDSEFEVIFDSVRKEAKGFVAPESIAHAARGAAIAASFDAGLALEGALFQALFKGSQAKALQYIFFAERRAQKVTDISDGVVPRPINCVGLLGYSQDSTRLVAALAAAGLQVRWVVDKDADISCAKRDLELCLSSLGKSSTSAIRKLSESDVINKLQNVQVSSDGNVLFGVDCSINCSSSVDKVNTEHIVIASTTRKLRDFGSQSMAKSIDISKQFNTLYVFANLLLFNCFSLPGFPHPMSHQRLMEIVRYDGAPPEDVLTLMKLGERLGKIPIVTKSPVGRRMLSSTILEALKLIDEGASILTMFATYGPY
jgi:3-hydroxyacyl-CoA dehydrogenase